MSINISLITIIIFIFPILSLAAEPPNLYFAKKQLIHYHDCGQYASDQDLVISNAKSCLEKKIQGNNDNKKLALVLDIDETALSLYEFKHKLDFGWSEKDFKLTVKKADMKVIPATLNLYNFAKKHGVAVFFISGRHEALREATIKNLKAVGYDNWDGLYLHPNHHKHKVLASFKTEKRKLIYSKGYEIIGNVGDQESDLIGDDIQCRFKLPNPFYFVS